MMSILFFHNTAPDYRIPFFVKLSQNFSTEFVFTSMETNKKMYQNDVDLSALAEISYSLLPPFPFSFRFLANKIHLRTSEVVVIPPLDSFSEIITGILILYFCQRYKKQTLYFWEKWRPEKQKQPIIRRIKEWGLASLVSPMLKKVDLCLVPGKKSREYLRNLGISENHIMLVHEASFVPECTQTDIRKKYSIPSDAQILLYYGRIIPKKGLDNLILAYSKLPESTRSHIVLFIAGDGDFSENCKKLSNQLRLTNVIFIGYVDPDYRHVYFSQCDIFVLPGRIWKGSVEAWGLTLNEALQYGKFIIASTSVGAAYELINEKNGIIVEENNVEKLSEAIIRASKADLKNEVVQESAKIYTNYNITAMVNDFITAATCLKKQ